ncbi:hypothetical protein N8I77_000101 [Diaporthe amygdali]|uniref:Uncharacterized protein n=1 Tax=Phomopsis amygdali TaxID=1214568 RepID=A0AAD9W9J7_PHOAM|nr:hypothetical protein N8I77_000101 [Diaporthe amygdali]
MKSFIIAIVAVCTGLMLATASYVPASRIPSPLENYTMTDVSWVVESIPGNATSTVYLNGSVQEILKQLIDINSNYPALLDQYWASKASVAPLDGFASLKAMSEEPRLGSWCDVCTKRWKPAAYMVTLDGISYLRNLTGQPGNKPGPGSCGRISCE